MLVNTVQSDEQKDKTNARKSAKNRGGKCTLLGRSDYPLVQTKSVHQSVSLTTLQIDIKTTQI